MSDNKDKISLEINTNGGGGFFGSILQWIVKVACVLFILYLVWTGWRQFGPQRPEADSKRTVLAAETAGRIVEQLRSHRGEYKTLAILPFGNDVTGVLTDAVRSKVTESGVLDLREKTITDKFRNFMNMRQYTSGNREEAVQLGKGKQSDLVLFGTVDRFETVNNHAELVMNYTLLDVTTGSEILAEQYDSTANTSGIVNTIQKEASRMFSNGSDFWNRVNRILGWTLIVFLLPVFTIKFLIAMTAKRSNSVNAFTLGFYTVIDIILALILIKPETNTVSVWCYFALFCVGALLYNIKIMTMAHRQTE